MWNKLNISIDERYSELMKMNELILGDIWEQKWCYNNNNNNNNNNSQISVTVNIEQSEIEQSEIGQCEIWKEKQFGICGGRQRGCCEKKSKETGENGEDVRERNDEIDREEREGEGEKEEGEEAAGAFRRGRCVWKEKCAAGGYDESWF